MSRFLSIALLVSVFLVAATPLRAAPESESTVLITGANRGIGLEMARQFSEAGYQVIGTARRPAEAAELNALSVQVEQLDVTDQSSVDSLAARIKDESIDLLINNAGVSGHSADSFMTTDFNEIAYTFDVNSLGPMRVTQSLLDNLAAGDGKTIVHISSVMGSIAENQGGYYGYRASKAALNMLNKSLSAELGPQGYVCIVMHPGWVKTRMGGGAAPVEPEESVAGMRAVIEKLVPADNGRFLNYKGEEIPW